MGYKGSTPAWRISPEVIVKGLFKTDSKEAEILKRAAMGEVELHSTISEWSQILLMFKNYLPHLTGEDFKRLHAQLPVEFHPE